MASWSADSRQLLFSENGRLMRLSLDGGAPMQLSNVTSPPQRMGPGGIGAY
jgi:hypothetical protein